RVSWARARPSHSRSRFVQVNETEVPSPGKPDRCGRCARPRGGRRDCGRRRATTTVRIPMSEPGPEGKHLTLEATLYRPPGAGRRPVLLFNHGSTGRGAVAATTTMRPSILAPFFVPPRFSLPAP